MFLYGLITRGIMMVICRFFVKDNADKPLPDDHLDKPRPDDYPDEVGSPCNRHSLHVSDHLRDAPPLCTQDGEKKR